jgi:hypothetical protein
MAIAHVQSKAATNFSSTTVTATWNSNTTTGNAILAAIWWDDETNTLSSVSDSVAGALTLVDNPTNSSTGGSERMAMAYLENITGGTTPTVTATFSGSPGTLCLAVMEISGAATSGMLDQHVINSGAADTNPNAVTSGNVTTTANNEFIFGCGHCEFNTSLSAGTNYTLDAGSGDQVFIEHRTSNLASAGSIAATFTESGSDAWMAGIMTIKEPGGGGGGSAPKIGAVHMRPNMFAPGLGR